MTAPTRTAALEALERCKIVMMNSMKSACDVASKDPVVIHALEIITADIETLRQSLSSSEPAQSSGGWQKSKIKGKKNDVYNDPAPGMMRVYSYAPLGEGYERQFRFWPQDGGGARIADMYIDIPAPEEVA